jgi:hypothetical protein
MSLLSSCLLLADLKNNVLCLLWQRTRQRHHSTVTCVDCFPFFFLPSNIGLIIHDTDEIMRGNIIQGDPAQPCVNVIQVDP